MRFRRCLLKHESYRAAKHLLWKACGIHFTTFLITTQPPTAAFQNLLNLYETVGQLHVAQMRPDLDIVYVLVS